MFYDNYVKLCKSVGKSPCAVAVEIGIGKSNVTYWKTGRNNPTDITLAKIADYFGVTTKFLTGEEQKENPGIPKDTEVDPIRAELLNLIEGATEEQCQDYLDMLRIVLNRREKR